MFLRIFDIGGEGEEFDYQKNYRKLMRPFCVSSFSYTFYTTIMENFENLIAFIVALI